MEERKRFIEDWLAGGAMNVAALCRVYAISRKTGYKWVERFRVGGEAGLEDRSHAARRQPRRIPASVERRLIEARRRHPSWGPKKLRAWLSEREPETVWPAASNDLWTIDYKGQFRTGDSALCYPLTVVDAHSRYLLGCAAHRGTSTPKRGAAWSGCFGSAGCRDGCAATTDRRSPRRARGG